MFYSDLTTRIKAGQALFHVETTDLKSLQQTVLQACQKLGHALYRWGPASGLECLYKPDAATIVSGYYSNLPVKESKFNTATSNKECDAATLSERITRDPQIILNEGSGNPDVLMQPQSIIITEFFEHFANNAIVMQNLIDSAAFSGAASKGMHLILTGPTVNLPQELLKYSIPLVFELPNADQLYKVIEDTLTATRNTYEQRRGNTKQYREMIKQSWLSNKDLYPQLAEHLKGLTVLDAQSALYLAISLYIKDSTLDRVIPMISKQKMVTIERSKVLRYIPYEEQPEENEIGGFENFLQFIKLRSKVFSQEAQKLKIDRPKGVALLGLPGTGKSLAAKALGKMLKLPVIIMDVGSVFGSLLGESESKVRDALKTIDGVDGCILFIDEADKAFSGNNSTTTGDSGTSQRVFGTILSWLQEHKSATFVVITLNRADALPPEFLRAGRFDKLFYTDLPTEEERKQIITLHFRKRDCDPCFSKNDWDQILIATNKFVGAELEEAVKESRIVAFSRRGKGIPTAQEFLTCCRSRVPMADIDGDARLSQILDFCKKRATPVSKSRNNNNSRPATQNNELLGYIQFD